MRKRCKNCGCYLDPGEWCRCDEEQHEEPEREEARRPIAKKNAPPPREWNSEAYIRQKWLEFDMR